ncbi:diguanylate cyclase/phosphodiesterase (GGDEF & EAL domains) with PAS/PAC sensor(s) [Desulfovibrio sp. TomC]|nr:diguanylate cyclase/phosphodiesterase (GGDEF & EAL domains) with PAS/PAC sensor(s) [Desulfovibrio sp. TomC]
MPNPAARVAASRRGWLAAAGLPVTPAALVAPVLGAQPGAPGQLPGDIPNAGIWFLAVFFALLVLCGIILIGCVGLRRRLAEARRAEQAAEARVRATEIALAESEERFHSLLDNIPTVAVQGYGPDRRIRYWNAASEAIYGFSREEVLGRDLLDCIIPSAMRNEVRAAMAAMADSGRPLPAGELTLLRKDGSPVQVFSSHAVVQTLRGETLLYCLDIAMGPLRLAEQKLRLLVENAGDAIYLADETGRFLDVNPEAERQTGLSRQELLERGVIDLDVEQTEQGLAAFQAAIARTGRASFETQHRRKDGTTFPVELRVVAFQAEGRASLIGIARDITDRRQSDEALRQSEMRLRRIIEAARDAIIMTDADGVVTFWNPAAESLLGYPAAEALGRDVHGLLASKRYGEAGREGFAEFAATGRGDIPANSRDLLARRKDGSEIVVSLSLAALDMQGRWHGVGILRDVTARKQVEMQLIEAKQLAEAASRAKSEFLANMSHEIRTPLNGILGMLELLKTTQTSGEQSEYIQAAIKSCGRLTRLLADILDISRIETGRMSLVAAPMRTADLAPAILDLFRLTCREKNLDLSCTLAPDMPPVVLGDEARVLQILFNLVGNAVKFTASGSVRVTAGPLPVGRLDQVRLLFTIADTGIGITDVQLATIFEPFVQVESSYTRRFQGAGLGLAIVAKLVRLLGGALAIDNTPEAGTTVYLSLPFGRAAPNAEAIPETVVAAAPAGFSILVAEDDEVTILAVTRMLQKAGHRPSVARNGREAVAMARETGFDLIFMDVEMPAVDGLEATRAIREHEAATGRSRTPIVALTAYAMPGDRERFLAAGMDDHLAKPVTGSDLTRAIARAAGKGEE